MPRVILMFNLRATAEDRIEAMFSDPWIAMDKLKMAATCLPISSWFPEAINLLRKTKIPRG